MSNVIRNPLSAETRDASIKLEFSYLLIDKYSNSYNNGCMHKKTSSVLKLLFDKNTHDIFKIEIINFLL